MAHRLQGRTSRPHPAGHQQARIRVLLRPTQGPALPGILPWVQAVVPLTSQPGDPVDSRASSRSTGAMSVSRKGACWRAGGSTRAKPVRRRRRGMTGQGRPSPQASGRRPRG